MAGVGRYKTHFKMEWVLYLVTHLVTVCSLFRIANRPARALMDAFQENRYDIDIPAL